MKGSFAVKVLWGLNIALNSVYTCWELAFEPHHDKTNNVAVRPAKTQISLGIRPV